MGFFTLIRWLPRKYKIVCGSHYTLLGTTALKQKGHFRDMFLVALRKSSLGILTEFHSTSSSEECLLPDGLWVPEPTEGIHPFLPSSPRVTQLPRTRSQSRDLCHYASVASKACSTLFKLELLSWLEPHSSVGTSMVSLSPSPQAPGTWLFLAPGPESTPRNPLFSQEGSEGEKQGM